MMSFLIFKYLILQEFILPYGVKYAYFIFSQKAVPLSPDYLLKNTWYSPLTERLSLSYTKFQYAVALLF